MVDQVRSIQVMVVDDEEPARSELRYLLEQFEDIEIIGEFDNGEDASRAAAVLAPQVIFIDIDMPGLNGMQTAEQVTHGPAVPLLVFATAHEEFAVRAFELNAVDYLLKPFSAKRIAKCIEKVRSLLTATRTATLKKREAGGIQLHSLQKLAIEHNGKAYVIDTRDIIAVYCTEGQLSIQLADKCYYSNMSLQDLQSRLDDRLFFRTHRSYLVNIEKIREMIPWFNGTYNLILEGFGRDVPVSRQQVPKLKKLFGL
ncbi:LytR/AlgR family response regulator transcription factor [Sporomusa termitida]|uniref:Sensory transduction protein LytR n=1 Tax=Sporomusa termitida TaxID=2377 RepID=A0A517DTY3_9FIRM|nr:LytTR family DNA-binding domain-containing protein [Sporomusa termitida]QDR80746.1 Sensory transduction protein LytR [Sporomusa termitida]